jgi:hypothetical protein
MGRSEPPPPKKKENRALVPSQSSRTTADKYLVSRAYTGNNSLAYLTRDYHAAIFQSSVNCRRVICYVRHDQDRSIANIS